MDCVDFKNMGMTTLVERQRTYSNMQLIGAHAFHFYNENSSVTAISVLSAQGVDNRYICSVSRHKNPGSLEPYCPGPDDEKRFL